MENEIKVTRFTIPNLNKANFWDELMRHYPAEVTAFLEWVDKYKAEVGWDRLLAPGIKFHDLPWEMQDGILSRYCVELFHINGKEVYKFKAKVSHGEVACVFAKVFDKKSDTAAFLRRLSSTYDKMSMVYPTTYPL